MKQETAASLAVPVLADPNKVTVSGQSAGGQFSCTIAIILSDTIKGAGCSKGGAFGSSYGDFRTPTIEAQHFVDAAIADITALEAAGQIDPTSNLANRAVYILSGDDDASVPPHNQEAIEGVYKELGTGFLERTVDAGSGHGFSQGSAHEMLEFILSSHGWATSLETDENRNDVNWRSGAYGTISTFD